MQPTYDASLDLSLPDEAQPNLDTLFRLYYPRLARLLYRVTGDSGRAEEVAAEAFWRFHHKPPPDNANVEGWLYRTAVHLALDQLKMARRRARYESLAAIFRPAPSPEALLEQGERRDRLRRVLASLKPQQAALILLYGEGLSHAETAAALRLNPNSVAKLLSRAEESFRKEYRQRYGDR